MTAKQHWEEAPVKGLYRRSKSGANAVHLGARKVEHVVRGRNVPNLLCSIRKRWAEDQKIKLHRHHGWGFGLKCLQKGFVFSKVFTINRRKYGAPTRISLRHLFMDSVNGHFFVH